MVKCYICGKKLKNNDFVICDTGIHKVLVGKQEYLMKYYTTLSCKICYNCFKKIEPLFIIVDSDNLNSLKAKFKKNKKRGEKK